MANKPWRERFEVHPAADLFPMMEDGELVELAEDIAQNGLREPIMLSQTGVLIDGRNRLEAIDLLERPFVWRQSEHALTLMGDAVPYIISKNIFRRHLTKSQRAQLIVQCLATR